MSRVAHIASRQLEASGAYYTSGTASPLLGSWQNAKGETFITLAVKYTKHASATNGRAKFRIQWTSVAESDGTSDEYHETGIDPTIVVSGSLGTVNVYDLVYDLKATLNGNTAKMLVHVLVPPNVTKMRVEPAEAGDTANPGTIVVDIEGRV